MTRVHLSQPYNFSQLGKRTNQEDYLCPIGANEQTSFFVVCDGVGGRERGEVASQLVCQTIEQHLSNEICCSLKAEDVLSFVGAACYTLYNNRAICPTMATTLAFMAKTDDGMLVAHLGDSRIYQIRKGKGVIFQTKDHSLVNDLLDEGKITPAEAVNHPKRNVITKCIFATNNPADYQTPSITLIRDIQPKDIFMLCTDGVYSYVSNENIVETLTSDISLEGKTRELAMLCKDSDDNNTAFLVEIASVEGISEGQDNISYTIYQPNKMSLCSRFYNFVRETIGLVK